MTKINTFVCATDFCGDISDLQCLSKDIRTTDIMVSSTQCYEWVWTNSLIVQMPRMILMIT